MEVESLGRQAIGLEYLAMTVPANQIPRALSRLHCFQNRSISMNVNDADQAISTKPVNASVPDMNRTAPTGTTSPRPSVVKHTAE